MALLTHRGAPHAQMRAGVSHAQGCAGVAHAQRRAGVSHAQGRAAGAPDVQGWGLGEAAGLCGSEGSTF